MHLLATQEDPLVRGRPVDEQRARVGRPDDVAEHAGAGEQQAAPAGVVDVDQAQLRAREGARDDGEVCAFRA